MRRFSAPLFALAISLLVSGVTRGDDSRGPITEAEANAPRHSIAPFPFPRPYHAMPEDLHDFFNRYPTPPARSYFREYHYESYGPGPLPYAHGQAFQGYAAPQRPLAQRPQITWYQLSENTIAVNGVRVPPGSRFYGFVEGRIVFSR